MKNLRITVNGKSYDVQVEEISASNESTPINDSIDLGETSKPQKEEVKKENKRTADGEAIKSPMPGTIVSVNVKEGQNVSSGDVLVILEAMKMENEILAPRDAVVSSVNVSKGQSVESDTILLSLK